MAEEVTKEEIEAKWAFVLQEIERPLPEGAKRVAVKTCCWQNPCVCEPTKDE